MELKRKSWEKSWNAIQWDESTNETIVVHSIMARNSFVEKLWDRQQRDFAFRFVPLCGIKKDPLEEAITRSSVGHHDEVLQSLNRTWIFQFSALFSPVWHCRWPPWALRGALAGGPWPWPCSPSCSLWPALCCTKQAGRHQLAKSRNLFTFDCS